MAGDKKNASTFGKRFEKKFVIDRVTLRDYMLNRDSDFAKYFEFDHLLPDQKFTFMENIHFDNPELDSYHHHLEKRTERDKLRIRFYNCNGLPEKYFYWEIKSKKSGETFKSRVTMEQAWIKEFIASGKVDKEKFIALNENVKKEKAFETLDRISEFVHEKGYVPMLRSSYMRLAFKLKNTNKVRVTVDFDLRFTRINFAVNPRHEYNGKWDNEKMIVEVKISDPKYSNLIPMIQELLGEARSFSKYCYGIYSTRDRFDIGLHDKMRAAFEGFNNGTVEWNTAY